MQVALAAVGDPSALLSDEDSSHIGGASLREERLVLVDDLARDARRDQLWGTDWTQHRVPLLPSWAELSEKLTACGVLGGPAAEVCEAREAITDAMEASNRLQVEPENEALMDRVEPLTELLITYARVLTDTLREIWSAPATTSR